MNKKSKILIACEESQAVLSEFIKLGFDNVYSCDLLETTGPHKDRHLKQDVSPLLQDEWDLIIAFPPCTDLASSGARHFERKIKDRSQDKSIGFFMEFARANSPKIAIENPIGIMSRIYRKPDQIIQPYQFGDSAQKSTCLWLKGLPKLEPTKIVSPGEFYEYTTKKGEKKRQPLWYYNALKEAKTTEQRRTLRSKTFKGIAAAMASQWTK